MKAGTRKHLPLLLGSLGAAALLAALAVLYNALPVRNTLRPTLAAIGGMLALAALLLLSFWFAARPSRPAHALAVALKILYGILLFFMAWQVLRDIEIRAVTADTWITAGILIAGIAAFNAPKIVSAVRRREARQRSNHVAIGKIYQIMGETHLDLDGDPVTQDHALIRYEAEGGVYETRADISRSVVRWFGKDVFIGRDIPVFYDPANPASAYADRIDRHFFDMV